MHAVLLVDLSMPLHQQLHQRQLPHDGRQHQGGGPVPVDQVHVVGVFISNLFDQLEVSYREKQSSMGLCSCRLTHPGGSLNKHLLSLLLHWATGHQRGSKEVAPSSQILRSIKDRDTIQIGFLNEGNVGILRGQVKEIEKGHRKDYAGEFMSGQGLRIREGCLEAGSISEEEIFRLNSPTSQKH